MPGNSTAWVITVDAHVAIIVDAIGARLHSVLFCWEHDARGMHVAVGVSTVEKAVAVVIEGVVADLHVSGAAVRRASAVWVAAVDEGVAIIVDAINAVFGGRHPTAGRVSSAVCIGAIDEPVTVVVLTISAMNLTGRTGVAHWFSAAFDVLAVGDTVAVVVESVVAEHLKECDRCAAFWRAVAFRVGAIRKAIAVVVDSVATVFEGFGNATNGVALAVGVSAADKSIAVVVFRRIADFTR